MSNTFGARDLLPTLQAVCRTVPCLSFQQTNKTHLSLSRSLFSFLSLLLFLLSLCLRKQRKTCFHPRDITGYPTFPPSRFLFKHSPSHSTQFITADPKTLSHSTNIMKAWKGVVSFFIISYCVSCLSADNGRLVPRSFYLSHVILNSVYLL